MLLPLLAACSEPGAPTAPGADPGAGITHVVMVVIDGVRLEECFGEGTNDLTGEDASSFYPEVRERLLPAGVVFRPAVQAGTTLTGPAHATLLTGTRRPFAHFPVSSDVGNYVLEVPSLFHALRAEDPSAAGLALGNSSHHRPIVTSVYPGASDEMAWSRQDQGASDSDVIAEIAGRIQAEDLAVVVANLHEADRAGHDAVTPTDYTEVARLPDAAIAALWERIEATEGYAGQTVLLVTADHGRHVHNYVSHGDACSGCRAIPMLWLGPGLPAGAVIEESGWDLVDVAPTLAALMGAELPWAEGLPITELLGGADVRGRSGVQERVPGAWVALGDSPLARASVLVDGAVASSSDAIDARGPVRAGGTSDDAVTCWRELALDGAVPGAWEERCLRGTEAIAWPASAVSSWFTPGLVVDEGELVAFYDDNPDGEAGEDEGIPLRLSRYVDGAWVTPDIGLSTFFPQWPTIVATSAGQYVLAWTSGDEELTARFDRGVHLRSVAWSAGGTPVFGPTTRFESESRQERPALWAGTGEVRAAWIAEDVGRGAVELVRSTDGGVTWDAPEVVSGDAVLPVVRPIFADDGELFWAERVDGSAHVFGLSVGGVLRDADTGSPRVESLAVEDGRVLAVVDEGVGEWSEIAVF